MPNVEELFIKLVTLLARCYLPQSMINNQPFDVYQIQKLFAHDEIYTSAWGQYYKTYLTGLHQPTYLLAQERMWQQVTTYACHKQCDQMRE